MATQSYSNEPYADEELPPERVVPEGIEGNVPYRGPLAEVVNQLVGGLRQAMGYSGAKSVAHLRDRAQFIRVTPMAPRGGYLHDRSDTTSG
jgi:IMP dehydrogenase